VLVESTIGAGVQKGLQVENFEKVQGIGPLKGDEIVCDLIKNRQAACVGQETDVR